MSGIYLSEKDLLDVALLRSGEFEASLSSVGKGTARKQEEDPFGNLKPSLPPKSLLGL